MQVIKKVKNMESFSFGKSAKKASIFLGALALAVVPSVQGSSAAAFKQAAPQASDFKNSIDWQQFKGSTLELGVQTHPWMVAMEKQIPQFEELTGIKVKYELLGEDVAVPKIKQQLSAGAATPDVFMVNALGQAAAAGWLEPLDQFVNDPKLTDKTWYKIDDIFAGGRSLATFNGKLLAMPISAEVQVLFTRSDLVKSCPKTMADLLVAAKAATKGTMAGFSSRGNPTGSETPWPFGGFSFSAGGQFLNAAGKPVLNSKENIAALKTYVALMKAASPKGSSGWAWKENYAAIHDGTLAMFPDSSAFTAGLRDATSAGKTNLNVCPLPTTNGNSTPNVWFWTAGINTHSANKGAEWLFLQWATSAPVTYAAQTDVTTARSTAWKNPAAAAAMGPANTAIISKALAAVSTKSMAAAWTNANWPQVADALARAVNKAITGGDPKKELDNAQKIALTAIK